MEMKLKTNNINYYRKLAHLTATQEETQELIVPDSLPDALSIVNSDGTAILKSKEAGDGSVTLSGLIRAHAIYMPEGSAKPRGLSTQIPFSITLENSEISPGSRLVATVKLSGIEARLLNSRKLLFRADLLFEVDAYGNGTIPLTSVPEDKPAPATAKADAKGRPEAVIYNPEAAKADAKGTTLKPEVRNGFLEINPVVDIGEKPFTVSEELTLPSGKAPISSIVKSNVTLTPEETKPAGAKAVVKGTANIGIVYLSTDTSDLQSADFAVPFSEIIDVSAEDDNRSFDVTLVPTGSYVQEASEDSYGASRVLIEIPILAQAVVWQKIAAPYIADAYSTSHETDCKTERYTISGLGKEQVYRDSIRASLPIPDPARAVTCVRVYPGRVRRDNDGFSATLTADILYVGEDDRCLSIQGRVEVDFKTPEFEADSEATGKLVLGEAFAAPIAGAIEIRVPVELQVRGFEAATAEPVTEVTVGEAKSFEGVPSLVLARVSPENTLWSIAKKYSSTQTLIRAANGLSDDADTAANGMLIVTRAR
ncbi:MAG: DUF3794 domain-containing protein [Oscillospiraceae bacterium]|jgi:LysM repeat protein|nr:DUF3794 domain-containing protein [Oscillospiraceae bacterium]